MLRVLTRICFVSVNAVCLGGEFGNWVIENQKIYQRFTSVISGKKDLVTTFRPCASSLLCYNFAHE
jgi:hypothetical protein